jgi:hypothetical protein
VRVLSENVAEEWRGLGAVVPLHLFIAALLGWLQREQQEIIKYLREENRVLKAQLRNTRMRFTDEQRRRLAALGAALGRRRLTQVATIVTPDTILFGIGSSSPGSGRIEGAGLGGRACSQRFGGWSYGWRPRIRRGAIPASKER